MLLLFMLIISKQWTVIIINLSVNLLHEISFVTINSFDKIIFKMFALRVSLRLRQSAYLLKILLIMFLTFVS